MPTASSGGLALGATAPPFSLLDPKGRTHALKDFGDAKGVLVIFMCNHCPYVKHLKKPLVEFAARYQPRGLGIVAINSNDWRRYPDDSPEAMQKDIYRRSILVEHIALSFPFRHRFYPKIVGEAVASADASKESNE